MARLTPLRVFVDVLVSEDLQGLVIDGETPPQDELENAWLGLYSEYCSLTGGVSLTSLLGRMGAATCLASKLERIELLLSIAARVVSSDLCAALALDGYKLDAGAEEEAYLYQIEVAKSKIASERMRLSQLQADLPKPESKQAKRTHEDFERDLLYLSQDAGYPMTDSITVLRYGLAVQNLKRKTLKTPVKPRKHG